MIVLLWCMRKQFWGRGISTMISFLLLRFSGRNNNKISVELQRALGVQTADSAVARAPCAPCMMTPCPSAVAPPAGQRLLLPVAATVHFTMPKRKAILSCATSHFVNMAKSYLKYEQELTFGIVTSCNSVQVCCNQLHPAFAVHHD
jgi:hypothetical protein